MILFSYLYLLLWPWLIWITYVFMGCMVWSLSGGLRIIIWVWCYVCVWMNVIRWVRCLNILFGKLMGFDGTLSSMHVVSTLLAICNSHVLDVGECFAFLKALGGIKCCVRFFVPRNPMKTLLPMWNSGNGSSSPVWSNGRGLVRVLCPLACVKQWGGEKCFTLFRLVASIMSSVRCIDVFTHNSLRNKGDSLAAM